MLSRKKFGVALLFGLVMCSSIYAKDVTKIGDTFSSENIENTIGVNYYNVVSATYTITKDNKLRAVGARILGSSVTESKKVWVDILKEPFGEPLENIVGVKVGGYSVVAWDSDGVCYYIGNNGTTKLNAPEKIAYADVSDYSSDMWYFIGESGKAYRDKDFKPVTVIGSDTKFKKVAVSDSGKPYSLLLDDFGSIYCVENKTTTPKATKIFNGTKKIITDIIRVGGSYDEYYFVDNLGGISRTVGATAPTLFSESSLYFYAYKGEIRVDNVFKLTDLSRNTRPVVIVKTNHGYWSNVATGIGDLKPVTTFDSVNEDIVHMVGVSSATKFEGDIPPLHTYITHDGAWHTKGNQSDYIAGFDKDLQDYTSYLYDWMNDINIISKEKIADFGITPELVYARENTMDINFSLLHNNEPKAFNVYFAPALYLEDRSKWVEIETNVTRESILKGTEDSGYKHQNGEVILKNNYSYNWKLPDRNLVDIVVVVEPVIVGE